MKKIYHLGIYNKNFGDTALNVQVDRFFKNQSIYKIGNLHKTKESNVNYINNLGLTPNDILIVGGGGILHEYTEKKIRRISGTLWAIPPKDISKIKPRIVLYSVGFNHFYPDTNPVIMGQFLRNILKHNGIISLRNDGSKERLIKIFPDIANNLTVVPDVGVFARPLILHKSDEQYVLIQIACDRIKKRYGNNTNDFIILLNKMLNNTNLPIKIIPHTKHDADFYAQNKIWKFFPQKQVTILPLKTSIQTLDDVLNIYANAYFTISTRGHSQIISIGNNTPTFSMSTHPKIEGFAKSCQMEQYNFNYLREDNKMCYNKFNNFINELPLINNQLLTLNENFEKQIIEFNNFILEA